VETLITILVGILVTVAVYLLLSRSLIRIIVGTAVLSHAVHLLLMVMGGLKKGSAPLLSENATSYSDPLPQALILTAIVISFAVTAFLLVLGYRTYKETGLDDSKELRGFTDE
jgi:multicomponent Na+:H+ antiporter subunit C